MRLPRVLHDETLTIIRVTTGLPDADGIPATTTTEVAWDWVNVQQATSDELAETGRDVTITTWRASGPPVVVDEGDQVRRDGVLYDVDGKPSTVTGRFRVNHTELFMTKATG